jgi:hypothetical protein
LAVEPQVRLATALVVVVLVELVRVAMPLAVSLQMVAVVYQVQLVEQPSLGQAVELVLRQGLLA